MAVMSTNAVAFLLLNRFRNGVSMEKLVKAVERLKEDLFCAGRDVGFTGETLDVINHAVSTLTGCKQTFLFTTIISRNVLGFI
jgi:glycerol-3-phosphate O-acyltransferase 1/2